MNQKKAKMLRRIGKATAADKRLFHQLDADAKNVIDQISKSDEAIKLVREILATEHEEEVTNV